jgi:hypothetical protein
LVRGLVRGWARTWRRKQGSTAQCSTSAWARRG